MTYSLQRYEGGNFAALQAVPDTPQGGLGVRPRRVDGLALAAVGYGARYEHYDYLDGTSLVSPRVGAHVRAGGEDCACTPRRRASRSRRAPKSSCRRPRAEWVPPQRTFSPLSRARASRRRHAALRGAASSA